MTRRPDSTDRAIAAERARAKHRHCVCGDREPCTCLSPPSPGWRWRKFRLFTRQDAALLWADLREQLTAIKEEITKMAVSTDELVADINTLVAGYEAVKAENVALKAALASADADKAAAVDAARAEEDADAQAKIDAADAVVDAANAPAEAPPAEEPPADGSV